MDLRTVILTLLIEVMIFLVVVLWERGMFYLWNRDHISMDIETVSKGRKWLNLLPGIFVYKRLIYTLTILRSQALITRKFALEGTFEQRENNKYTHEWPVLENSPLTVLNASIGMSTTGRAADLSAATTAEVFHHVIQLYELDNKKFGRGENSEKNIQYIKDSITFVKTLDGEEVEETPALIAARELFNIAIKETYPDLV